MAPILNSKEVFATIVGMARSAKPEIAETGGQCLNWLARKPQNHRFFLEDGGVEILLDLLKTSFESHANNSSSSPSSYAQYVQCLQNLCFHLDEARRRCGQAGVRLALRMMRTLSVDAVIPFL